MTLILKLGLDMVKMYLYAENELPSCIGSKVIAWTDRHTDRQTDTQTDRPYWNYYLSAYADGNNARINLLHSTHKYILISHLDSPTNVSKWIQGRVMFRNGRYIHVPQTILGGEILLKHIIFNLETLAVRGIILLGAKPQINTSKADVTNQS